MEVSRPLLGINDDEGVRRIPSQQRPAEDGTRPVEQRADSKYTSHRNIVHSGINGIRLQCRIEKD